MTTIRHHNQQSSAAAPIFVSIQTSAFSGATLLARLLSDHPAIATVGEMNGLIAREDPHTYLCSCGQKIQECHFWRSVTQAMRDQGFEFDVTQFNTQFMRSGPLFMHHLRAGSLRNTTLDALRDTVLHWWPRERRETQQLVARNAGFIHAVLAVTGKRIFVDTSKDRLRLSALQRFSTLDVRAIHLVRDVRGVIASRLRRGVNIDAYEAARQWARLHQRLQRTVTTLPANKQMRVRYEDLCTDPGGTLKHIYQFCGADPSLSGIDAAPTEQHIIGNPMRLTQLSEIKLDERWRTLLTAQQLKAIDHAVGTLNSQFGYR